MNRPAAYKVLALDLATTFGWAYGGLDSGLDRSGSARLRGDHIEERAADFMGWMIGFFRENPVHDCIWEAPIAASHLAGQTRVETTQILFSLPTIAGAICLKSGLRMDRMSAVRPDAVRKHFTGRAKWGSRKAAKRAVIDRCRQLGHRPLDDNEADAIAIFDYRRAVLRPSYAAASGPLFSLG